MMDSSDAAHERPGDSLDLLGAQDRVLAAIFAGWDASVPAEASTKGEAVKAAYDHGTWGKLLIEHAAVRVAAKRDIERVLREVGCDELADQLTSHLPQAREALDRLDELSRGVEAVGLGGSAGFAHAVGELADTIRPDLGTEPAAVIPRITAALGDERRRLRSAKHVAAHAPTHPGTTDRWYDGIPALVRLHAEYDHLRGFPSADSTGYANTKIADHYEGA